MDYVGMIGSGIGGVVNGIAQHKANNLSAKEAEKNRRFNAEQAKIQRDATSPYRQMQQMRMGGFNPAASGSQSISQGGTSASSGELPSVRPESGFGDAISNAALVGAQIENIEADTAKKKEEANNIHTETDWIGKLNQNKIELNNSTISLNSAHEYEIRDLTPERKREINATIENIDKDTQRIGEEIDYLKTQEDVNKAKLKEIASQTCLNNALSRKYNIDANLLLDMYDSLVDKARYESEWEGNRVVIDKTLGHFNINIASEDEKQAKTETQRQEKDLEYYETDKVFGYAGALVGMFSQTLGAFTSFGNMRNGSRMAGAMERSADARVSNAETKAYDSSVNAIEKESRATLNRSKSINEQNKWYDHNGIPDKHRSYKKVEVPKRRKK